MDAQVFYSHHHGDRKICNCTMCPKFDKFYSPDCDGARIWPNFCTFVGGRIPEPEISWCVPGIAFMWVISHQPDEVVELLTEFSKQEANHG